MFFVRYKFRHFEHNNTTLCTHFSNISLVSLWLMLMTQQNGAVSNIYSTNCSGAPSVVWNPHFLLVHMVKSTTLYIINYTAHIRYNYHFHWIQLFHQNNNLPLNPSHKHLWNNLPNFATEVSSCSSIFILSNNNIFADFQDKLNAIRYFLQVPTTNWRNIIRKPCTSFSLLCFLRFSPSQFLFYFSFPLSMLPRLFSSEMFLLTFLYLRPIVLLWRKCFSGIHCCVITLWKVIKLTTVYTQYMHIRVC